MKHLQRESRATQNERKAFIGDFKSEIDQSPTRKPENPQLKISSIKSSQASHKKQRLTGIKSISIDLNPDKETKQAGNANKYHQRQS